jgi:hypothetical protein
MISKMIIHETIGKVGKLSETLAKPAEIVILGAGRMLGPGDG